MSNWDMCFYCKMKVCSLDECPSRDKRKYVMPSGNPKPQNPDDSRMQSQQKPLHES